MKRTIIAILVSFSLWSRPIQADLFGGDVAVLTQILVNAIQQLAQLRNILESTKGNLELMQEIHRGIHDAMAIMKTMDPRWDPGLYGEWTKVDEALRQLQSIYGVVVQSPDASVQQDADQSAVEAIALNNAIYSYTKEIDQVGERIKSHAQAASPAGAQKLTAKTLGVMLHVLNEGLRAQATGLKLQAQTLAIQNKKEKALTENLLSSSRSLQTELKQKKSFFNYPKF